MPYDAKAELKRVTDYYKQDKLQKRFSALITGETNAGKTYLLRSARRPVHIDSFDVGGTKCLKPWIDEGHIIADTQWEGEDPWNPDRFAKWMKAIDIRLSIGYFNNFGTYALDSLTKFSDAVMGYQLKSQGREAEAPKWAKDYMPQKTLVINYLTKLMSLPCDFFLMTHLEKQDELLSIDSSTGIKSYDTKYRIMTTGNAVVTIPLLFDEIYVLRAVGAGGENPRRELLVDSLGKYIARSRLKSNGKLDAIEEPDIKKLLKKVGMSTDDLPKLEF